TTLFRSHDLLALRWAGAIGDERELDAELLQPVEGFVRAGKHAQLGFMDLIETVGERIADLARRHRSAGLAEQLGEGALHDVAPRLADPMAPMLVPRLVGPEIFRIGLDRGDDLLRRVRREMLDERADDPLPLPLRLT